LIDQEWKILDFWSPMYDYSIPWYETFAACIDEKSKKNRMLLREVMMQEWFAPFDGEYRHFSYGDKEWAYYYNQWYALYDQITLEQVKQ
jgi:D-alanyl-D-alanine dipeptidase